MQTIDNRTLRPHTVLELLDRTFSIYRQSFATFIALVAAVVVPITIVTTVGSYLVLGRAGAAGFSRATLSSNSAAAYDQLSRLLSSSLLLIGILVVLGFVQGVLLNSTLTYLTSERLLGRSVTIGQAFSAVRSRFAAVGTGLFFFYLAIGGLALALVFVAFCFGLAIPVLFWLGLTMYAFLIPVLVLERTSVTDGMNRAWSLAKSRFWAVFGFTVLIVIITSLISFALNLTVTVLVRGSVTDASFNAAQVLQTVLQAVVTIFMAPILPIGYTVLYYDTRIRLEGLDIALQSVSSLEPRPSDLISPPSGLSLNRSDALNIGITLAIGVILGVLYFGAIFALLRGTRGF